MKKLFTLVLILVFATASVFANNGENKVSANTINLISEINETQLKSATETQKEIGAYIIFEKGADPYIIEEYGAKVNMNLDTIISARIPLNAIDDIASLKEVKYIDSGRSAKLKMDSARTAVKVDDIRNCIDLPGVYYGKDVVFGIIDCGLQYDHINFRDKSGNLRLKRVWQQNSSAGTPPEGYSYGVELKTEEEMINAKYDSKSDYHATSVAGIAAGSYRDNNLDGIAPESDIVYVAYNIKDNSASWTTISDGLQYICKYAESVGKPCVVNMSLGVVYGPHDGCSIFDQVCDILQGEGKLFVGSSGNEGANRQHIKKEFTAPQDSLRTFVTLVSKYGSYWASQCDFYGEHDKEFKIKICIVKTSNGVVVSETECFSSNNIGTHTASFSKNSSNIGGVGSTRIICELEAGSKRPHINVMTQLSSISTGYSIGYKIIGETGTVVHGWTDDIYSRFTNKSNLSGWTPGDLESNIGELGGTGKRIISVGSYKTKDFNDGYNIGKISNFSSKGPTLDGRMKPDIAAPGEWVVSSFSNSSYVLSSYGDNISEGDTIDVNGENHYFGSSRGTSMSAPIVAGSLALWLEANPNLTPEDVRTILAATAIRDSETGSEPNNTWGYGKFDAWAGLKMAIKMSGIKNESLSSFDDSVRVFNDNGFCNILFTQNYGKTRITIFDISGKVVYLNTINDATAGSVTTVENSDKFNGIYIVRVEGENGVSTNKVVL